MYNLPNVSRTTNILGHHLIPGGGYMASFGRTPLHSRNILNTLVFDYSWFDNLTRILIIEFTAYNPHVNCFVNVKLTVEISVSGDYLLTKKVFESFI
ncbi:polycystic kidney disease protein 1-like 2 [Chrysoperla carnea]|uniref:polycystic kidney disease protein 1-like 2 n=1 Tax=Chrysoperla carnea TaxID=189513 RepID=UPI001D06863F|nr:polycystic kidney disease protein 1-like 2 [Chrysoperla carnea]